MDKKKLAIALLVVPIGLHAKYPWNAILMSLALIGLLVELIWQRKKYSSWMTASLLIIGISALPVLAAVMDQVWDGHRGFIQLVVGVVGMLCGIVVMGIGNYVQNPNRQTRKIVMFMLIWLGCIALMCLGLWYFTVTKNS